MTITHTTTWLDNPDTTFHALLASLPLQPRSIRLYGKTIAMPRLTSYHGDRPYTYSGQTHDPSPWPPALQTLRERLSHELGVPFNVCLANLYRDGKDSVSRHSDDEPGVGPTIASLSLGAPRRFKVQPKDKATPPTTYLLEAGDLLVMQDCQHSHDHWVPKTATHVGPRLNLTFRVQA